MIRRRKWLVLALAAAAVVGYLFVGSGDERRIVELMRELLHAAELAPGEPAGPRKARIASTFAEGLELDVRLAIPELGAPAQGRVAVQALAIGLAEHYRSIRFKIEQTEIRVAQDSAEVTSHITLFATDAEELRDTRQVTLRLNRHSDGLRIASVTVAPRSRDQPEARP